MPEKFEYVNNLEEVPKRVLERYENEGRFDLSTLNEEERVVFEQYYREHMKDIDSGMRAEILEQFLLFNVISEKEAIELLENMPSKEVETVGRFVAAVLEPGSYPRVFHLAWQHFSGDEKLEYIRRFTEEDPSGAIWIAPFTHIANFTKDKDAEDKSFEYSESYGLILSGAETDDKKQRSIVEEEFGSLDKAQQLFEACLERPDKPGIRSLVQYYSKHNQLFLVPHVKKLLEHDLLTEEKAKDIISGKFFSYARFDFFATEEEEKRIDEIENHVKKLNPEHDKGSNWPPVDSYPHYPADLKKEIENTLATAKKRAAEYVFSGFKENADILSKPELEEAFEMYFLDMELPIVHVADEMGLNKEDIRALIKNAEEFWESPLRLDDLSDIEDYVNIGLETEIVDGIIHHMRNQGRYTNEAQILVRHLEDILPVLSDESSDKLVNFISTEFPEVWLLDIDTAVEQGYAIFSDIYKKAAVDPKIFFEGYYGLIYGAGHYADENNAVTPGDIKNTAREFFREDPSSIVTAYNIFCEVYSEEEQDAIIKEGLTADPPEILKSILGRIRDEDDRYGGVLPLRGRLEERYAEEIERAIHRDPDYFVEVIEDYFLHWDLVKKFISTNDAVDIWSERHGTDNEREEVVKRFAEEFLRELSEDANIFNKFISSLKKEGNAKSAASTLYIVNFALGERSEEFKARAYQKTGDEDVERSVLPEKTEVIFNRAKSELISAIEKSCRKSNELVFSDSILRNREYLDVDDVVSENVSSYIGKYPTELLNITKYLSPEEIEKAVTENIPLVAYSVHKRVPGYRGFKNSISRELFKELRQINPFLDIKASDNIDQDYYREVIDRVKDYSLYPVVEGKLNKLAENEIERHGEQTDNIVPRINPEFELLVRQLSVLEHNPAIQHTTEAIKNLPEAERETIMSILEVIILNGADKNIEDFAEIVALLEIRPKEALDVLYEKFEEYFRNTISATGGEGMDRIITLEGTRKEKAYMMRDILIYYSQLSEEPEARESLQRLAPNILSDNFHEWRTWGEQVVIDADRDHALSVLKDEKLIPEKISIVEYLAWSKSYRSDFEDVFDLSVEDVRRGVNNILDQAVANHHIPEELINANYEDVLREYDVVLSPVMEMSEELKYLKEKVKSKEGEELTKDEQSRYKELQGGIAEYRKENKEKIQELEALIYIEQLKSLNSTDLSANQLSRKDVKIGLKKALQTIERAFGDENPAFIQDVRRIEEFLEEAFTAMHGEERVSRHKLSIADNVNLETYFRIGEEPVPTCQSYTSDTGYNEALLSYVADPNVKIIQIYDDQKRLIARSVLRLLADKEGKPQLFLERVYSVNLHPKIEEAIIGFARKKAKSMGVELYSPDAKAMEEGSSVEYKNLFSKGSRHSSTYTDAGGTVRKNGVFTIRSAIRIN